MGAAPGRAQGVPRADAGPGDPDPDRHGMAAQPDLLHRPQLRRRHAAGRRHAFVYIGSDSWLKVPVAVWVTGAIFLVAGLFLAYHRTGRAIYAIGGNVEAARAAGIRVDSIRIAVFTIGSALAAIGGLMET